MHSFETSGQGMQSDRVILLSHNATIRRAGVTYIVTARTVTVYLGQARQRCRFVYLLRGCMPVAFAFSGYVSAFRRRPFLLAVHVGWRVGAVHGSAYNRAGLDTFKSQHSP